MRNAVLTTLFNSVEANCHVEFSPALLRDLKRGVRERCILIR